MFQHLPNSSFRSQAVEFTESFRFAVFDEFIRPTDALDWRVNTRVVEIFDDGSTETVEKNVILEGADNFTFSCEFLEHGGIERLDKAWVDECHG